MMKKILYLFIFLFNVESAFAQSTINQLQEIHGLVFLDSDNNGIFSNREKGLKDILVSNGVDIVKTDKNGEFKLTAKAGQSIFPIIPDGFRINKANNSIGNANFIYLDIDSIESYPNKKFFFGLTKEKQASNFKIGAIGDVQVDNDEELDFASRSIFKELNGRQDLAFNIFLGDQVNDQMDMIPKFQKVLNMISSTSWTLVGNHDRNTKNPMMLDDEFNRHFGAATYSFNYGDVHFVVLNNVFATGKNSYEGRVSNDQLSFLRNDLSHVPTSKTVVICQHIPMAYTRNRAELFDILKGYENVLILSGHTHQVQRYIYPNTNIQELGVGATCGNWWTGEQDIDGIPQALMQCGTPRGYFTVNFSKGEYGIDFKAVGLSDDKQMGLYIEGDKLIANIYGGSDSTKVTVKLDSDEELIMSNVKRVDPLVQQTIDKNKSKSYPTEGNRRNPLGSKKSSHIWEVKLPSTKSKEVRKIRIKAIDNYGFNLEQEHYITY